MPTNLNNSDPAAPANSKNVTWQSGDWYLDAQGRTVRNASAYIPEFTGDSGSGGASGIVPAPAAGDAAAGKFLKADGTFAVPPGGSVGQNSRRSFAEFYDDFIAGLVGVATASIGALGWRAGGNGSDGKIQGEADHPGIYEFRSGSTNGNSRILWLDANAITARPFTALGSREWTAEFCVRFPENTSHFSILGFRDDTTAGSSPTEGIVFDSTDGGNWFARTKSGGSQTSTDTGIAKDADFHVFEIRSDGSGTITFHIDGAQVASHNANVPAGGQHPSVSIKTNTAAHRLAQFDYFYMNYSLTR
ncbi:MAG TPA: hypothetical protein VEB03_01965 [Candidatus Nanoarchaeia archaeon]|nr:hypothetical protein [Candidatus Nanoarchaeia archaeon]